ncbi:pterin-4-alpha-carbinolamine dehydratase 2, mitochondrial isoform X1 [Vigna umbellata]|uniref:pterin-4-alpha-carbinolamine dehydratase 2, mitochondrial isoform X1 n=1 Tax=Vigna umbellata TaxID=87088 RepID=UPI001F5F33E5|nr:pterin-4-alpha-carbinolamine dehydratase 2, mitochondrial isoform X1 [Vigna umbellata]
MAASHRSLTRLTDKKCVPCNLKELRPMSEDSAQTLMPQVPEWNLVNDGGVMKLRRSWTVRTFSKGLDFFRIVSVLAESEGHHPDLHLVDWNNVTIEIWTHAVGSSFGKREPPFAVPRYTLNQHSSGSGNTLKILTHIFYKGLWF